MLKDNELIELLKQDLLNASNSNQAIEIRNIFTKKYLAPMYKKMSEIEDKKTYGQQLNHLKILIENETNLCIERLSNSMDTIEQKYDIELVSNYLNIGHAHILNIVLDDIFNFFSQLNFEIVSGNEVVNNLYNFENLNIPNDHPARNMHDSFYINNDLLLRTHCTSTTAIKIFNNNADDIRILSYGNVYRKDDDDATHSHQFMQVDLVWIKKDLNLTNLKWIIDNLLKYLFNNQIKTRYRLSYFPFTEPSFEVDISCFNCDSKGCNICKNTGWIEVLGAGLLHPNVLSAANISEKTGIAAGIGIERIAMLKYGIQDIRMLYNNDFFINRQFKK